MRVILISERKSNTRTFAVNGWAKMLLSFCLLGLPLGVGVVFGIQLSGGKLGFFLEQSVAELETELESQRAALAESRQQAQQRIEVLSSRLARLQARLVRLDALGERLTNLADLDKGEFDFSATPALGGPEVPGGETVVDGDLQTLFAELETKIDSRQQQLGILESMMADREIRKESTIAGRPVSRGWMSSGFGMRADPFNGRKSWHGGVDFAGREGNEVVAVASGVVTWSGKYRGYGHMVEIDHGEGFVTRYAHNKENKVEVGDVVERGRAIALLGSSGRATGPHVHFEVYKNGRQVDPSSYISRTLR